MGFTTRAWSAALVLCAAVVVTACGGGGDDGPPPTTGAWTGTTSTNRALTALLLSDGSAYFLYSGVGAPTALGGAIQGTGAFTGLDFASADALDFSVEGGGISGGSIAAAVAGGPVFAGTFTGTRSTFTFQTAYNTNFNAPPSLQQLAGNFTGQGGFALGIRAATFAVTGAGAVSSEINGCAITGSATPRRDGNVYDLSIAFGAAPCALPGLQFTGIAYLRPDSGQLIAIARNAATRQSVLFSGTR
jgi:hypothetical protein